MESTPFGVVRVSNQWSWMNDKNLCRSSGCVSITILKPGHWPKYYKNRASSVSNWGKPHNKLFDSDFSKKWTTTGASDATTAVATMITQGGFPVVRRKLVYGNHSLSVLAMCNTESSISFVDRSLVSTLQLQDRKASLSAAGIHVLQEVKTEIVPSIGFNAQDFSSIENNAILCSQEN